MSITDLIRVRKSYFLIRFAIVFTVSLISSASRAENPLESNQPDVYTVDSEQSSIRIITDKGGLASFAAHQHVISMNDISGTVSYSGGANGSAELSLAPQEFSIDEPQDRADFPDIFDKPVPDKAIQATRKNMLSDALLNAQRFPEIKVSLSLMSLQGESAQYQAKVRLKDNENQLNIPGSLKTSGDTLHAKADFNLANADVGLKVFSAMFGAISVGKKLRFLVDIQANRAAGQQHQ